MTCGGCRAEAREASEGGPRNFCDSNPVRTPQDLRTLQLVEANDGSVHLTCPMPLVAPCAEQESDSCTCFGATRIRRATTSSASRATWTRDSTGTTPDRAAIAVTGASVSVRSGVPSCLIHSPLTRTRTALPRTFAAHFIGFAARVTLGIFLETMPSQMPRLPAARSERLSLTREEWMPWFGTA